MKQFDLKYPKTFPVLETENLTLFELGMSFAEVFHKMRSDETLMLTLDKLPFKKQEESEALLRIYENGFVKKESIDWAIVSKQSNAFMGTIGYHNISFQNCRAEIGYVLSFGFQRQGFMSEAMQVVLEYGFKNLNLHTIYADVNPLNEASKGLLGRFGFEQEAHLKQNLKFNSQFLDSYIYGLVNPYH